MDLLCLNTSGELSIDSICQADIVSAACSACVINVCLSAIIYIRCTQHIRCGSLLPRHCTRSLLFLVLLLAHLTEMADGALQYLQDQQRPLLIVVPTLSLAGWCAALALVRVIETDGRAGFLSVTGALWLLCGTGKALRLVYLVETGVEIRHVRLGATAWVTASFVALSVVDLHGLVRCKRKGELRVTEVEEPPRGYRHATAHLFSQATFSWLTGLLWVGYCSPLEIEDLGQLPEEETTERQLNLFNCIYEKEKNAARNENRRVSLWKCYFKSCWRRFLLGGLFKLLGDFVGFVGPLGIMVILEYVAAIQKPPDNIIGGNKDHYPTWSELLSNGYFMGLIVFLSALAQGTLSQSSTHLINVEGIHLKGALQALVYIKALRLCVWSISEHKDEDVSASPEKKDSRPNGSLSPPGNCPSDTKIKGPPGTDMGAITNLMSEDAFNVMSFFWIGHYIWAIPLKICVLMYFLYLKLGWSAIIGAAFCILTMTPLQFLIGKKMSSNSKAITELSDERLRRMNEVLQGIKLLKLYGWECIYGTRIVETRKRELGLLDKDAVYWALLTFLTHASSVLVTLVTFGVYFSMEEGALSPGNVFTGLALFNQLTVPLFIFPITVPVIISAMVSTKRLEDFLSLPETSDPISQNEPQEHPYASDISKEDKELRIEEDTITKTSIAPVEASHNNTEVVMGRPQSDDNLFGLGNILEGEEHPDDEEGGEVYPEEDEAALTVERALFSWSADSTKSVLSVDDVSIMKGKLTIIIGRVGSGKTSLLSSILGEMNKISGTVKWASDTTVAYAAQKPWLLNATLRDNILFGQAYRPRRYKRVIGACALQPDIDILPGKDLTEIGEKGINMSGGQKQRIAVARALYSQANVVVLDDPLSALDYQVGQQVFEEGIRRMLLRQRRTVILVTHRLQLLSYAHKIIAVEQGSVRAQGNLSEIESVDPELVRTWKATMSREALEGQRNVGGRTAKERWKLVKLVSRIGVQLKQRNVADGTWQTDEETHVTPPLFVPLRKRLATFSGSRYLTHDLPLPIDECEADLTERTGRCRPSLRRHRAATMADTPGGHKAVLRAFSLQTGRQERLPFPVVRQFSSPSIRGDPMAYRSRMYTVDSHPQGSLLRRLFHHQSQRTVASAPEVSGCIKEKNVLRRLMSSSSTKSTSAAMESVKTPVKRLLSTTSASSDDAYEEDDCCDEATDAGEGRTMSEEEREYGKIPKRIYLDYLRACGVVAGVSYLLSAVLWQGLRVYTDYWLSQWTHHSNDTAVDHREDQRRDETVFYFGVYASLSAASIILSLLSNGIGQYAGAQARRTLHDNMLHNLLKCPMKFFESTPVGRIINRFSMDTGLIDKKLATSIQRLLQFLLLCFSAILVNAVVTPWFLLAAVPICATYYVVQHFYRYSSRELQRLDSITRSPIFSHFSETLGGLTTIRAFSHQQRFTDMLLRKMDTHANAFLIMNTANRWLGIALDYLGGVIVLMAIVASLVTATLLPGQVPPALVGLAVNYTLLVPIYLNWVVKFLADVEMYMNDVERVQQYATTPTEDYRTQGVSVPHSWPEKGDIVFENVSLRYDSKREPVITNLNLHIPPGQKVGICGRTGSGKSSLVMSLFHMVDVYEGSIEIDGIDITQVPLQVLRSRLSIIPQDVIMFSGTIRENLDPRHQYSDEDLWRSLEMAQLKDIVSSYQGCLDGEVREGGENLSAGERQLFCLARAILHDAACLIMDEATSSVDPGTEKALLAAAAKAFANKTVITIAHRLPTILECDRIVVLDEGRIAEDGSPAELMNKSMGVFSSMLKASNEGAFS